MKFSISPASPAGKWLGLVTAVWVQAIAGNNYTFSNYSDALKTLMSLTQLQLNNLSAVKDVGKAFGLLAGVASDRLSTPVILLIGCVEGFVGYGVQWLVVSRRIQPLPYWIMCIFVCMGGNSSTWLNTAVLVTCIRNFQKNRGDVSGILKGYVGLSTAIFTDICSALFAADPAKFLLMLAVAPLLFCAAAIIFLREVPPSHTSADERKYFNVVNVLAVIIALYLLAYDVSGNQNRQFSQIFAVILIILLISPLAIPIYLGIKDLSRSGGGEVAAEEGTAEEGTAERLLVQVETTPSGEKSRRRLGEEHTIYEAMKSVDFWILFGSFLCGIGTGVAVMNNMGQMGRALGYSDVSIFVSLNSIWGFFGRILSGSASEYFIKRFGLGRPIWNAASQIVMTMGYVYMAMAMPGSLYVGSIVMGICCGVRLAITVPVASELFGLKYYGLVYNILTLNLPLGSFLFSGLLAGFLYDAEATPLPDGGNTCLGAHCYRMLFIVLAIVCVVGFALDLLLHFRTKFIYVKKHYETD